MGIEIVALSADGKRAVSGSANGNLRVHDLEGNEPPRVFGDHTDNISALALSADGERAVSGSWDETVRVWDLEGNQVPHILKGQASKIRAVALSAAVESCACAGERIVAGDACGRFHLFAWEE